MSRKQDIEKRLREFKSKLDSSVCLVAVTKYSPFEDIAFAYEAGHRDFGENRVDDLLEKSLLAKERGFNDIRWHMIGHLQSNKINKLIKIENLYAIHSIDRLDLLEKLIERQENFQDQLKIFLEVNTSKEDQKSGFSSLSEIKEAMSILLEKGQRFTPFGLMTMATIRTDDVEAEARRCFSELRSLRDYLENEFKLNLKLSMGMSGDYQVALSQGSDFIRIGSAIFKGE